MFNRSKFMKEQWQDPVFRAKRSKILNEISNRPEVKDKRRELMKNRWKDPKEVIKLKKRYKEAWKREEVRDKHIKSAKNNWQDPNYIAKHRHAINRPEVKVKRKEINKEIQNRPEVKAINRVRMKRMWQNPKYKNRRIKNIFKGLQIKPNKPEQRFIEIIKKHNLPYKYVGDGQFFLAGRCPDFLNCNGGKKVIEVFGKTYHSPLFSFFKVKYRRTYQGTIEHYKKYGFKCLIIWDYELDNEEAIIDKIKTF